MPQVVRLFFVVAFALADFAPKGQAFLIPVRLGFDVRDDGGWEY
jgi:hypothetical protein